MSDGILVVGGGFAGFWAAVAARRVSGRQLPIRLITREPVLQIRPRLYEADPHTLGVDLRPLLASVDVDLTLDTATGIDTADRQVLGGSGSLYPYERVVVAAGSVMSRPPLPGIEKALSIDTQVEAIELDQRLRAAAVHGGPVSIGVIGAGFTGVELALELRDRLDAHGGHGDDARIVLIERAGAVGPELGEGPRPIIEQALDAAGVEQFVGAQVEGMTVRTDGSYDLTFAGAAARHFDLVVLTTGLVAAPFTSSVPGERDRIGRIIVDRSLRAPSAEGVFVAGDAAAADVGDGHHTLQSCQHAMRSGRFAGENAARDLLGMELLPYEQLRYVTCLDLGRSGAVLTSGWDRTVQLTGEDAKQVKRRINTEIIYPPAHATAAELLESSVL